MLNAPGIASSNHFRASRAHSRLSATQAVAVRTSPNSGTSQNAAPRTPRTAPKVFAAYSAGIDPNTRCIAGSVAPIAAVAGNKSRNVPQNATNQCHAADGCGPIRFSNHPDTGSNSKASARLQTPITASLAAYQRAGFVLR